MSNFYCFGYKKGSDGAPVIVPEQAEIVKFVFNSYLLGCSLDHIKKTLQKNEVLTFNGKVNWSTQEIQRMLKNEKYSGDLLLQKTYTEDSIEQCRKVNHGGKNKYLVKNNHPAITERTAFDLVQAEMQRRSKKQNSGLSETKSCERYCGKYALTNILVCRECGAKFKRNGKTTKSGEHKYY